MRPAREGKKGGRKRKVRASIDVIYANYDLMAVKPHKRNV